ncbi:MAG: C39 family peptidase [Chloroflexota bacterium]
MKRSNQLREMRAEGKARRKYWKIILPIIVLLMLLPVIYRLPPVHDRLSWRVNELRTRIAYAINPPDEAVFIPQDQQIAEIVQATLDALGLEMSGPATPTPPLQPSATNLGPTLTPTITATPLPGGIDLREQVVYVDQHGRWNYCGPANLTMSLKFWGWDGNRDQVAEVIKPGPADPEMDYIDRTLVDKNVMPYEMVDYVNQHTPYRALSRYGGDIEMIKHLLANGFPVMIEKGYYEYSSITKNIAWMGHYLFVTGYDDAQQSFIVQDAYLTPGESILVNYEEFQMQWRYFNYVFILVFPQNQETKVMELLGPRADKQWSDRHALDIANQEISELSGLDLYFAWFNKGTSHVQLYEYVDASFAYDYSFLLYADLTEEDRPYRIMWYQTWPYFAYFYSGRYQDVINLANTTLFDTVIDPTLEESFYWRGMARLEIGETGNAVDDFLESVRLNPNFSPGWAMLEQLGVQP